MSEARRVPKKRTVTKTVKATTVPKKPTRVTKVASKTSKTRKTTKSITKKSVVSKTKPKTKLLPKKLTQKSTVKKVPVRSRKTPVTKKKVSTNQPKIKSSSKKTDTVVTLPTRMSIRAREKVLVYTEALEKRVQRPAYALTMTFGILFIAFGSAFGLQSIAIDSACADGSCAAEVSTALQTDQITDQVVAAPTVSLLTNLPRTLTTSQQVTLQTKQVSTLEVFLTSFGSTGNTVITPISTKSLSNSRYQLTLNAANLTPNRYKLQVKAYNSNQKLVEITLGSFIVPNTLTSSRGSNSSSSSGSSSSGSSSSVSGSSSTGGSVTTAASEQVETETVTTVVDSVVETTTIATTTSTNETIIDGVRDSETTQEVDVTTLAQPVTDIVADSITPAVVQSLIISSSDVLSGVAPIDVQSADPLFVNVYLRRAQSTERQLAGRFNTSEQNFKLNTRNFPNGDYELFMETSRLADATVSNSLQVRITNQLQPLVETVTPTTPVLAKDRDILKITKELIVPKEPAVSPTPTVYQTGANEQPTTPSVESAVPVVNSDQSGFDIQEPIRRRALEKLEADTETLDALFTTYAVAIQSGNPDLIRESRQALTNYRQALVETALANEQDRFIADDLGTSLEAEIEQIALKVETFESLRRERLEGSSSIDTDKDGITDTDERVLFKTDPLKADTDGDGFTDGVEIIRGFNPNDAASEAVIVYRSPKETVGIVANKNLVVAEVVPNIQVPESISETATVQATVRGTALPNSFITLYIFSTPTVVTVRTEADGSFEYTFSKELEDGEHQVFVALTDNTGDIVAQSEPFTFIKQAEAFTAVDAQAVTSDSGSTEVLGAPVSPYRTVLSMSVLALGILLILLGIGLRSNKPEETNLPINA